MKTLDKNKSRERNKSRKIRTNDTVIVIAGNHRGSTGKVMRIVNDKVYITGVNLGKKHVKPTQNSKGGIVELERPIHISNLQISIEGKPVKLKVRQNDQGKREFYYQEGNKKVTYRSLKSIK